MKKKFKIFISIRIKEDDAVKTYEVRQDYDGDPKKLDISVMIDGWFLENDIDKSKLDGFYVDVCNMNDDYNIPIY